MEEREREGGRAREEREKEIERRDRHHEKKFNRDTVCVEVGVGSLPVNDTVRESKVN